MHKNNIDNSTIDQVFSRRIIELSKLNSFSIKDHKFGLITESHGALVQDENFNIFYDLRSYSDKPFWGHNHPLQVKAELLGQTLTKMNLNKTLNINDLLDINKLEMTFPTDFNGHFQLYNDFYIEVKNGLPVCANNLELNLLNFFKVVLFRGERFLSLTKKLTHFFEDFDDVSISNLTLKVTNIDLSALKTANDYGLYINNSNFDKNNLYFYLPTSFTQNQLDVLLSQISNYLKDIKCL